MIEFLMHMIGSFLVSAGTFTLIFLILRYFGLLPEFDWSLKSFRVTDREKELREHTRN